MLVDQDTWSHAFGLDPWGFGAEDPRDLTPPTVTDIDPAPGSQILPDTPVSFSVTDDRELAGVWIFASQQERREVVWSAGFVAPYLASVRVPVPGGWRYTVVREGGWLTAPVFRAAARDTSGNVAG